MKKRDGCPRVAAGGGEDSSGAKLLWGIGGEGFVDWTLAAGE